MLKVIIFRQRAKIVAMMIFFSLIGTVSVIGNFIVLFVVYKSKRLRHSQYVYKCSIAVSDIVWGFTVSIVFLRLFVKLLHFDPTYLSEISFFLLANKVETTMEEFDITVNKYQLEHVKLSKYFSGYNKFISVILLFITPSTLFVSFFSLLFASIDRYVALTFPFKHKQINNIKIARIVSVVIWLLSAIVNTVTMFSSIKTPQMSILFQSLKNFMPD